MSRRDHFLGYAFDVTQGTARIWDDGLQVEARAMYSVAKELLAKQTPFLEAWDGQNSYMIGLYIWANQTIEVSYRDVAGALFQLVQDDGVTRQLNDYFGAELGKRWVGLVPPDRARRRRFAVDTDSQTVAFDVFLRVKPATTAQFIPFVGRYRFDPKGNQTNFSTGFMPGMWRVPRVESRPEGNLVLCDARGVHAQA